MTKSIDKLRPWLVAAAALGLAAPASAAVQIIAVPNGTQRLVFEFDAGYSGGPVGVQASLPVTLSYAANQPGDFAIFRTGVAATLEVGFTFSGGVTREYYPEVDPNIRFYNTREGGALYGTLDSFTAQLRFLDGGNSVNLLTIASTTATTRLDLADYRTVFTTGGQVFEHQFGAATRRGGTIQAGTCHFPQCTLDSPQDFTLTSDVLRLNESVQPGSFTGFFLALGNADAGIADSPETAFTVPLSFFALQSAVPELSQWALLLTGFALTGATLRRRRLLTA